MRLGADFLSKSRSKFVSKKWPKWLTPKCVSKPSSVFWKGTPNRPSIFVKKFFLIYEYKTIELSILKYRHYLLKCLAFCALLWYDRKKLVLIEYSPSRVVQVQFCYYLFRLLFSLRLLCLLPLSDKIIWHERLKKNCYFNFYLSLKFY